MQDRALTRAAALVDLAMTGPAVEPDRGSGITLFEIMLLSAIVAGRLCGHRTAPPGHTIRRDAGDQPARRSTRGGAKNRGVKQNDAGTSPAMRERTEVPRQEMEKRHDCRKMAPLRMWGMWFS